MRNFARIIGLIMLCACAGCAPGPSNGLPAPPAPETPQPSTATHASHLQGVTETWEAHFLRDPQTGQRHKVGYRQVIEKRMDERGKPVRQLESLDVMQVLRFGEPTNVTIGTSSVETLEGEILRFRYQMNIGANSQHVEGQLAGHQLDCRLTADGRTTAFQRPWRPASGGFFAMEQGLRRQPMRPGEQRTLRTLQPLPILGTPTEVDLFADVGLIAEDFEVTSLPAGTRKLLRIRAVTHLAGEVSLQSTLWADERGEILKTTFDALGQETFRTSREFALRQSAAPEFDFSLDLRIPLDHPLPMAHSTTLVEYEVILEGSDPSRVFACGASQEVNSISAQTARVTVRALRPDQPAQPSSSEKPPADGDLKPSPLIQSDDTGVIELARSVGLDESDPWRLAVALERLVHERVALRDFSQVLTSAAQVADSQRGDCTEHAVLLAALCRARQIPARVAVGLVYAQQHEAFLYHMWNEAWISDRWIPLDATLGQGGIGAAHLKLDHSDLQGAAAYASLLKILDVVGRLKIKVVRVCGTP